ncbi:MAG: TonB-dependent receptor [Pseudomonadota bacterium]
MSRSRLLRRAVLCACSFAAVSTATAQPAPSDSVAAEGIEEIVVTAQRREENLQSVPLSVAALAGDTLRDFQAGGEDILALSGRVPGLYAESTTGRIFPRFYIRGLGNVDFYLGASQPVSIIQDDVVLEHVVLKSKPLYHVARNEVQRGPQGSLFGRNTTAGIIKFDTVRPSQEFDARLNTSYGQRNTATVDGGIGGAIVDGVLAGRLSVGWQRRSDWVDNNYSGVLRDDTRAPQRDAMGGYSDANVRGQLLWTPTDALSVLGSFHVRNYSGTSTLFRRNGLTRGSNEINSNVDWDSVTYDEAANNPQEYDLMGGQVQVTYDFGPTTLTSISAWESAEGLSRGDTDGGVATIAPGQSMGRLRSLDQYTQELRLASNGDGPFAWQFGGYWFQSADITEFYQRTWFLVNAPTLDPNTWVRLNNRNDSWAVFGQGSWQVSDQLKLTAGARWTEDTKETRLLRARPNFPSAFARFVELEGSEPSWDLSAMYQFTDDVSAYARIASGFRGPTIQGRSAVFNSPFTTADSETILSYEVGLKTQLFDRRLRFNVAAFTYTVDDIQLNGNDANGNGILFNAKEAEAYGLEADVEWRATEHLSFTGGFSLLETEIKDPNARAQTCALGGVQVCTVKDQFNTIVLFGANAFLARLDGNPLPNAPEYTVDLRARYAAPFGPNGEWFVTTDWSLQGYTSFVLYESEEFNSDGNFEGGLRLGYARNGGAWEVALYGRNITNEKNLKGAIENHMAAVLNEPRTVGVSFTVRTR